MCLGGWWAQPLERYQYNSNGVTQNWNYGIGRGVLSFGWAGTGSIIQAHLKGTDGCLGAFLWGDLGLDQWSKITQIMLYQRNRWIHSGRGFIGSLSMKQLINQFLSTLTLAQIRNYNSENILITEALDKQLKMKISDSCEWRFNDSLIIFKFVKTKSQILYLLRMCVKNSLHVIKSTTMWNVDSNN